MNKTKTNLHPRNKNRPPYDLRALVQAIPDLENFIEINKFGTKSINFAHPTAIKLLNKALLHHYYGIEYWEFPDTNLCPPIPSRADYLHYAADLLSESNKDKVPKGKKINILDIGVGASCIYPILGVTEYGWNFVGSDVDKKALQTAQHIVDANPSLQGKIELRLQKNPRTIFQGIIRKQDRFDLTICNPPFHASLKEAQKGTRRKIKNLSGKKTAKPPLNFSGNQQELVYQGGELEFIKTMIQESKIFANNGLWFSTLVSKRSNLDKIHQSLKKIAAKQTKTIPMQTGNKSSRIVAWTFS